MRARSPSLLTHVISNASRLIFICAALADSDGIISMIRKRIKTNKAAVRKAALLCLESIIKYNYCHNMDQASNFLISNSVTI